MTTKTNWRDEFRFPVKPRRGMIAQGYHTPCGRFLNGLKVMENHAKHTCSKLRS